MHLGASRLPRRAVILSLLLADLFLAGVAFGRLVRPQDLRAFQPAAAGPAAALGNRIYLPLAPRQPEEGYRHPSPLPTPQLTPPPSPPPGVAEWQAKIEIVWPHDGAPLRDANLANITAYLIAGDGHTPPPCQAEFVVRLWRAVNTGRAQPIAVGQKRLASSGDHIFPVWDFNDVDVSPARDPANRLSFFATVDGLPVRHNVWIHGADARTVFPQADVPIGVTNEAPRTVEARLEILWLHDGQDGAGPGLANLTAYLFDAATGRALSPQVAWSPQVQLHWAANNEADKGLASSRTGIVRTVASNGLQFLAWDFNDVDVSMARDARNKLHFWLSVDDIPTLTNIWTHGAVAPTIHTQADVLDSCTGLPD